MASGPSQPDYYAILGAAPNASGPEIERAFRKRAKELHPDLTADPDAEAKMAEVNDAYGVLSDPTSRARYDARVNFGLGVSRHIPAQKKVVTQWSREENDARAREIRERCYIGDTVHLEHRFDVQDVAIKRGDDTFIETVLTMDDQVLENVDGEVRSVGHSLADDRAQAAFAGCADQVEEAFGQLSARRMMLNDDIKVAQAALPEGSTVWVNDIPYKRERVDTPLGKTLVMTRDGRVLDNIGVLSSRRWRATLIDYAKLLTEVTQLHEGIERLNTIIRDGVAARIREPYNYSTSYYSSGSIPGDHVVVNGATYAVYIVDCLPWSTSGQARRKFFPITSHGNYKLVRPPGIEPPPPPPQPAKSDTTPAGIRVSSAYLAVKVLCRDGRPLEDLPTLAYEPSLRGYDLNDLEAWKRDSKEVGEKLKAAILQREAAAARQKALEDEQRLSRLKAQAKQEKREKREERKGNDPRGGILRGVRRVAGHTLSNLGNGIAGGGVGGPGGDDLAP